MLQSLPTKCLIAFEDEDEGKSYMTIAYDENCIGCKACSKACPLGCLTHSPLEE